MPSASSLMLGADPEFVVIHARSGNVRLVGDLWAGRSEDHNQIGIDHGGALVEIRPEPSLYTHDVVVNMRELLTRPSWLDRIRSAQYKWRAGGFYRSSRSGPPTIMGGHVHFGPSEASVRATHDFSISGWGSRNRCTVLPRLDWATSALELSGLLPLEQTLLRRMLGNYGQWGNWQCSVDSFEYRTPSSWLASPEIAFVVLTTYKLAAASPSLSEYLSPRGGIDGVFRFIAGFARTDSDAERVAAMSPTDLALRESVYEEDFKGRWAEGLSF